MKESKESICGLRWICFSDFFSDSTSELLSTFPVHVLALDLLNMLPVHICMFLLVFLPDSFQIRQYKSLLIKMFFTKKSPHRVNPLQNTAGNTLPPGCWPVASVHHQRGAALCWLQSRKYSLQRTHPQLPSAEDRKRRDHKTMYQQKKKILSCPQWLF